MTLAPGDKFITLQTRTGPVTLPYVAPAVGEKALFVPDGKGHHIAVKYAAPSVGDSFLMVPDKAGNYIAVKPGDSTPPVLWYWDDDTIVKYSLTEGDIIHPLPGATIAVAVSRNLGSSIFYASSGLPHGTPRAVNSQAVVYMRPPQVQGRYITISSGNNANGTFESYARLFGQSVATGAWISTTAGTSGYGDACHLGGYPGTDYPVTLNLGETCRNIRILVTVLGNYDGEFGAIYVFGQMTLYP